MPELPDVEGFRRVVGEHATHQRINAVCVWDTQVLRSGSRRTFVHAVEGGCLAEPQRLGKWLLVPTSSTSDASAFPSLLFHFGMTGMLVWAEGGEEEHGHDRVAFRMGDGELRYRDMRKLTGIDLARDQRALDSVLDKLGPDACEISYPLLRERLTRSRRQIKSALMDQACVCGLGNLCVDEILWRARIQPRCSTTELGSNRLRALHTQMRSVLRSASNAGHVPERPSWLTGHRDAPGDPCPRCQVALERGKSGGRTTLWCAHCQAG